MIQYRRRPVGAALIDEIRTKVASGQSCVVLGPRYGGKRHVLSAVRDLLKTTPGTILVCSDFPDEPSKPMDVWVNGEHARPTGSPVEMAEALADEYKKVVCLVLSTVDSIPHHEARKLLSRVQVKVADRRIVALLAGECNLRDLVHGPKSEFNKAVQYILQGYELPEFERYLNGYEESVRIRWTSPDDAVKALYQMTGGSTYLLRMLLSLVLDWRAEKRVGPDEPIDPALLLGHEFRIRALPETYWAHIFHYSARVIASHPECWQQLEQLLTNGHLDLGLVNEPLALELSGLAVLHRGRLQLVSKLIHQFAQGFYTKRRYADLYAQDGQWLEAFRRYRQLHRGELIRPCGPDDLHDAELVVRSLGSAMHEAAGSSREAVETLFRNGCSLLLGFPEVAFWTRNGEGWRLSDGEPELPEDSFNQTKQLLASAGHVFGWVEKEDSSSPAKVTGVVILRSHSPAEARAVAVGDFAGGTVISPPRERLLKLLSVEFFKAHANAVRAEQNLQRLQTRDAHIRIVSNIFSGLGSRLLDQQHIFRLCAQELRGLGYSRVLFSLVDPERTRITGAWCDPQAPIDLAAVTDYPLDRPNADVQPWVVVTGKAKRIPDARREPLCNQKAVGAANHIAMAVVPIIDHQNLAVGTIHIEREDGAVPTEEEVDDLMMFGRMLSGLLAQVRRMTLIYEGLNQVPEPLLITDRACQVKFANQPACDLFPPLKAGWQETPALLQGRGGKQVESWFQAAQEKGRQVLQLKDIGDHGAYQGEVLAQRIDRIGTVIHIDDQNFLNSIFEAIHRVGQARTKAEMIEALLDAFRDLGFDKVRYYAKHDFEDLFISTRCRGHSPENTRKFENGAVKLPRSEETSWRCVSAEKPPVFLFDPHAPKEERVRRNEWGLEAEILRGEMHPVLEKTEGSVRVDVRLKSDDVLFGKLSVERVKPLKPEELSLISVLGRQSGRILQSITQTEKITDFQKMEDGMRRAMAVVSHQFRNELTPLDVVLTRYQRAADKSAVVSTAIAPVNADFLADLQLLHSVIDRMPDFLGTIHPRYASFDLMEEISAKLGRHEMAHEVTSQNRCVPVEGDRIHLGSVLNELLDNTRAMWHRPNERPKVRVTVSSFLRSEKPFIRLVYEDFGPGIPEEIREHRIFEAMYSYRPGRAPGTGIGLDYARRVIAAHGGEIRTEASATGACFVLEIPQFREGSRQ